VSIRLRRLQAEYERLTSLFSDHERIRIAEAIGDPPDRYVIEYRVKGLVEENGEIKSRETHRAQITLGHNYPRERPRCVMLTPVFHPNIDHLAICTEDIGAAGQTLDQTIVFIGAMLAYQAYNLQSPRNGDAARWTDEHRDRLPLEGTDLMPRTLLHGAQIAAGPAPERCANCGRSGHEADLRFCSTRHRVCGSCRLTCSNCQQLLCPLCATRRCEQCEQPFCADCLVECAGCHQVVCLTHVRPCKACHEPNCVQHSQGEDHCAKCSDAQPHLVISRQDLRTVSPSALGRPAQTIKIGPPEPRRKSGKAVASLVFAIVGIPIIGLLLGWFAILFGGLALREINRAEHLTGRELAFSGMVVGAFDVVLWIALVLLIW
jgi:ubiquitin-protein ligase